MSSRRLRRLRALVGVGVRRVIGRATGEAGGRIRLASTGVAVAVAVLVLVTAVGVGLAADATVHGSDVDYWITPESGGGSALVDTGGPALGAVHDTAAGVQERPGVSYATPVLARPLRVESADGSREYVLAVGVVGRPDAPRVAGLSPAPLEPGDPHYADGGYDGSWTGDLVASPAAATILDAEAGDSVPIAEDDRSFTVRAVDDGVDGPVQDTPIVLVQLSELQAVTGAAEHDQADQLLVASTSRSVRDDLAGLYPRSTVETRSGLLARGTVDDGLPLALAVTGFLVAFVVGTLVVCTTLGMEVVADRRALATMAALGLPSRSRLVVVGTQVLATTLAGGIAGTLLGVAGIAATNRLVAWRLGLPEIAVFHPLLALYGVGVAVLVGACSLPYLLVLVRRIEAEEVGRSG